MQVKCFWSRTLGLSAIAGLFVMVIPSRPANAVIGDEFRVCARELVSSGLSPERASEACGTALRPADLSECVLRIQSPTSLAAEDALSACFRVRRPVELANCTVNIGQATENLNPTYILDYCRRSLLPERFSECVVGLGRALELSPPQAMQRCIAAEDYPLEASPD